MFRYLEGFVLVYAILLPCNNHAFITIFKNLKLLSNITLKLSMFYLYFKVFLF